MTVKPSLSSRFSMALKAFRETLLVSGPTMTVSDFDEWASRLVRYDILFSMYENTTYRQIHSWANLFKTNFGLYQYTRNIYNPTFRLVEFWKMMVWGGLLDPEAGETGAIPIITENASLRTAIAKVWEDSNWALNKDMVPFYGTAQGDAAIKIIDDPDHGTVHFEVIPPSMIFDYECDVKGNVKSYILRDRCLDDEGNWADFEERVTREEGEEVHFETFKNGKPYAWNGIAESWTELYGFVPFVMIKHFNVGRKFGWSEIHPDLSKVRELDDIASKLHDYIRKSVDPVWLFNFRKPKRPLDTGIDQARPTTNKPEPGREELPAIYADTPQAKAQPLVTDLVNVEHAMGTINGMLAEMERDYPELQMDIWTVGGYTTGKAMRTARQKVERKVIQRRPSYDQALISAHNMAVAIGGYRGYEGYEGFNLNSFKEGKLKHSIPATRPIFQIEVLDAIEAKQMFWNIIGQAKKNLIPLGPVLADLGWTPTRVEKFLEELEKMQPEDIDPDAPIPDENGNEGEPGDEVDQNNSNTPKNEAPAQVPAV